MGIFTRMADIVNSNLNAILDVAEEPDKIIRLVIQEMEETLVEVRSSAARAIADQKDAGRKLRRLADLQEDWAKKAELAISKGREDLAKAALVEKAKAAEMTGFLKEDLDLLKEALGRHDEDVVKLEAKLREARAKKMTLQARHTTVTNQLRVRRNLYSPRIEEAFARFEKVEARLDRIEGEAEAFDLGKGRTLADEINDLAKEEEIASELKAIKAKVQRRSAKKSAGK
ncbi:MAG: phage shock protein PspA [Proteobacteria bacterium]|nr:phage shock protein PspA [Pseudomonadota bacterium]